MGSQQGKISRRSFLRRSAAGMGGLAVGMFSSTCGSRAAPLQPQEPTAPDRPVESKTADLAPEIALNRLVRARHAGVWQGTALSQEALRQMLDSSLAALTGMADAEKAWAALFHPGERVAIKVNAIISGASHVPLVMAITERLQDAGIAAEDIVIYDRRDDELRYSGFALNQGGSEVRCTGSNGSYGPGTYQILDTAVRLSRILDEVDALINVPVLKGLTYGGISFAMKNHYGTLENPSRFHDKRFDGGITGLNALEPLRSKTRLIVGDVLATETHADDTNYAVIGGENCILVGAGPVTVDLVGRQMCLEALDKKGIGTAAVRALSEGWLKTGAELGLGASELSEVDLQELSLS